MSEPVTLIVGGDRRLIIGGDMPASYVNEDGTLTPIQPVPPEYAVWFDEAASIEPWQFDLLLGRSPTEPPSFDGFPYKRLDLPTGDDSIFTTVIGSPTPKQRPPKKAKPRRSKEQRKARQAMRRAR